MAWKQPGPVLKAGTMETMTHDEAVSIGAAMLLLSEALEVAA